MPNDSTGPQASKACPNPNCDEGYDPNEPGRGGRCRACDGTGNVSEDTARIAAKIARMSPEDRSLWDVILRGLAPGGKS